MLETGSCNSSLKLGGILLLREIISRSKLQQTSSTSLQCNGLGTPVVRQDVGLGTRRSSRGEDCQLPYTIRELDSGPRCLGLSLDWTYRRPLAQIGGAGQYGEASGFQKEATAWKATAG